MNKQYKHYYVVAFDLEVYDDDVCNVDYIGFAMEIDEVSEEATCGDCKCNGRLAV